MPTDELAPLSPEVLRRFDVPGPRYTSYPTVPEWSEGFGSEDYGRALGRASAHPDEPLSVYVHIPFCRELCTYCGCNVIVSRDPARADRYLDQMAHEIALVANRLGRRRTVTRLHLGGGTPTFLSEAQLERLWSLVVGSFRFASDAEAAIEIDPVVTSDAQLATLRRLGFSRLSMGVQDLDPDVQRAVQRVQSYEETRAKIDVARALGFTSVNVDLIYGLPRQTPSSWARTLDAVMALRPDRASVFSFAFVPAVRPNQRKLPVADIPTGMAKAELFRQAFGAFVSAGYRAIGFDHFALPDDELARAREEGRLWRDFQGYTTHRASETIAFGVSGISDVGGAYAQAVKTPGRWQEALAQARFPVERGYVLDDDDRRRRAVITSLMCNLTVDLARFPGASPDDDFAEERADLERLAADGLVTVDGAVVTITPLGRWFVRNVAMVFDAHLRRRTLAGTARQAFSRTV